MTVNRLLFSVCLLLPVACLVLATPPWPSPYWDIPGDYCRARYPTGQCCLGRQDPCAVPILGTLCYCDTFCNRTGNSDCCPDYFEHCEGLQSDDDLQYAVGRPEEVIRPDTRCRDGMTPRNDDDPRCFFEGNFYSTRETIKKNCNLCRCQVSPSMPSCMELLCETLPCLFEPDTASEIRRGFDVGQYSWKAAENSSVLWGHTLADGLRNRLGTFKPEEPVESMSAIKFRYRPEDLPNSFDARDKWPDKIVGPRDQGWCGASWAFSTSSVASDRFAIESIPDADEMSPQALISCNAMGQSGCRGGYVDRAWNYLRKYGTLPEDCYPYESFYGYEMSGDNSVETEASSNTCRLPRTYHGHLGRTAATSELVRNCPALQKRRFLFRTQPAYRVGRRNTGEYPRRREQDIMFEMLTHGPVQATMEVFSDFFMYESGVYARTNLALQGHTGLHSVKIIGWGEENGVPYWLCVNSWGTAWGEEGLFKILRGSNECGIEDFVVGVWAQTEKRLEKIRERRRRRIMLAAFRKRRRQQLRHQRA